MAKNQAKNLRTIVAVAVGAVILVVALALILPKVLSSGGETDESGEPSGGGTNVSSNETIVTYEKSESGATISLTYYARGDKVYKQTAINTIPYEVLGVSTKEEAKKMLDELVSSTRGVKGYEDTFEYRDDMIVETVSIDYEVIDMDEAKDLVGAYFNGDTSNGISLSKSIEWLEEAGFTKVEK